MRIRFVRKVRRKRTGETRANSLDVLPESTTALRPTSTAVPPRQCVGLCVTAWVTFFSSLCHRLGRAETSERDEFTTPSGQPCAGGGSTSAPRWARLECSETVLAQVLTSWSLDIAPGRSMNPPEFGSGVDQRRFLHPKLVLLDVIPMDWRPASADAPSDDYRAAWAGVHGLHERGIRFPLGLLRPEPFSLPSSSLRGLRLGLFPSPHPGFWLWVRNAGSVTLRSDAQKLLSPVARAIGKTVFSLSKTEKICVSPSKNVKKSALSGER